MTNKRMTDSELCNFAKEVRRDIVKVLHRTADSHIGSGFSSVDILTVLYQRIMNVDVDHLKDPNRDVLLISKGHIAASVFTVLAHSGFIPLSHLDLHLKNGENYAGHTRRYVVPGVEMSAGSLGHGSCMGAGMAYAKLQKGYGGSVFVLMGDGECNEGSVWESAMLAARFNLSNLVLVVDRNLLQSYGSDGQVMRMGNLQKKFDAFGCRAIDVDGHNFADLTKAFEEARLCGRPTVLIAHTVKGKGVSFMENRLEWHFKSPNDEQMERALKELS